MAISNLLKSSVLLVLGVSALAGATLCVDPNGGSGCYSTINAAVTAAIANDTIRVSHGTYTEDVVIDKPLALIGESAEHTIIDATGLPNGIDIDGHHNPGLSHVSVTGFTVMNANYQGILVTDASFVSISKNHVTGNDVLLNPFDQPIPTCPGLPVYFQAGEGFDCGEGIHLSGVSHSTVANNLVDKNAGGILLSDDTGPNHDNLISGNLVQDNPYDCGITIASHHFAPAPPMHPELGVFHITVVGNTSQRNGLQTGEGAGVGIFAGPPGAQNWGNVISGNVLTHNALPGVTLHSHTINQTLADHLIVGNRISENGPDSDPGTTVPTGIVVFSDDEGGAPPVTGVVISQNIIKGEGIDIAIKTPGSVDVHFNSLLGDTGIDNLGTGTVNATENWWKCSKGPDAEGCSNAVGTDIQTAPWLAKPF